MMPRYIQPVSINIELAQSHSPPSCIAGPLTCSRDRRCSRFGGPHREMNSRKLPHHNGLHLMSIYRMIWWITAVILAASGGIAAAVTVQTDVLVSAVIAAVLIGGGFTLAATDHTS